MLNIKKLIRYLSDDRYRFLANARHGIYDKLSDEEFIRRKFFAKMGWELNLENPQTYNEKLQWLKLHDRRPVYQTLVDKYEVKKYISDAIGKEYVIPVLGVWDRFDQIDFSGLPDQFVLKCTHDSGGLVICKDKSHFNYKEAKKKIEKSMKRNFFYFSREWPYKDIKPRILAEAYMEDAATGELRDYKLFCFDGKVRFLFVASDRQKEGEEVKFDFFDRNFKSLPIKQGHPNSHILPEKPEKFEEMVQLAQIISKDIPHVRVDFYQINGRVYFGECTFFHFGGFVNFIPREWDLRIGGWLNLPERTD